MVKAGKNTPFLWASPSHNTNSRRNCTRKRGASCIPGETAPFWPIWLSWQELSGHHRVFTVAELEERHTDRGSREDWPLPGIHLAVRQNELGTTALSASGRRCPSLTSQSLTAIFYLRQGWSCHKSHVLYPWLVHVKLSKSTLIPQILILIEFCTFSLWNSPWVYSKLFLDLKKAIAKSYYNTMHFFFKVLLPASLRAHSLARGAQSGY